MKLRSFSSYFRLTVAGVSLWLAAFSIHALCQQTVSAPPLTKMPVMPNILYGASYYHEYEPTERLDEDIKLMKQAGFTVVRMGESTWSLWEPEDGHFAYAWMDHVVDALGTAGIEVIMGTPTYSIPTWMYHEHPEILARQMGGREAGYGMRQNMDESSPAFRFYAQRLIRNLVEHYRNNPAVIGWQVDNETSNNGATNHDQFVGFVNHLKQKFGTTDNLNKAWLLNYWGEDVNAWEDMPTRDNAQSTGYKLEWSRWEQMEVTDYLSWQAALVREYRRPDQFVTHDFSGGMHRAENEFNVAKALDIVSVNIYHGTQDSFDGATQALRGDFYRSLRHENYLVTETNAQAIGWDSAGQFPPYDGQARLDVYSDLSSGANMVEYWHWATLHSGQETYWKGVLGHDLEPNRFYREVSRTGGELEKIGPHLVNLKIKNKVGILYSVDSANALTFMPFTPKEGPNQSRKDYFALIQQIHRALFQSNVGVDFIFPEQSNFSDYKLVIVPALYIADDAMLRGLAEYVKSGGHVLMTFKSGFADENSTVRHVLAPGPMREAAGVSYQEFSSLVKPIPLKGDPFHAGKDNQVMYWAEMLKPEHAKALAYYDHPFFGRWAAITENSYGAGTLLYEGAWPSDHLQKDILLHVLKEASLTGEDQALPPTVRMKHGVNSFGKTVYYYMNYGPADATFNYPHDSGKDLLTNTSIAHGQTITLKPWGLEIIEQ